MPTLRKVLLVIPRHCWNISRRPETSGEKSVSICIQHGCMYSNIMKISQKNKASGEFFLSKDLIGTWFAPLPHTTMSSKKSVNFLFPPLPFPFIGTDRLFKILPSISHSPVSVYRESRHNFSLVPNNRHVLRYSIRHFYGLYSHWPFTWESKALCP